MQPRLSSLMRAWIAIALASACTRTELSSIDLSDRTDTVALLVVVDEADRVIRITHAFGIADGRVSFGERPQVLLAKAEIGAVLIEMTGADLSMRFPDFLPARASEITARLGAPPEVPEVHGIVDPENPTKETALPPEAKLTDLIAERAVEADRAAAYLDQLTLTLPIDPEYCRPTTSAFSHYGRDEVVVPIPDGFARALDQVIAMGDRVLLRAGKGLHVLERGEALDLSRSFAAMSLDEPGLEAFLRDVAVAPQPNPDGSVRLMLAVRRDRGTEGGDALLVELRLDDRIEYVRTATRVELDEIEGVSISAEGRTAAVTEQAIVLLEEQDGSYSARRLQGDDSDPKGRSILWMSDPVHPLAATSRNRVHFFDAARDQFFAEIAVLPTQASLHVESMKEADGVTWAVGNTGWMARLSGGAFDRIVIDTPPRYSYCATSADPEIFEDDIIDVALHGGYAFLVLKYCSAVMAIRRSDGCVSILSPDGEKPRLLDDDVEGLRSIDAQDGELLVTDALSRIWRVSL